MILSKLFSVEHKSKETMKALETILDIASRKLPESGIDCILIGGFAVNYYGYTRNTLDVDFMIFTEQLTEVRQIMVKSGFTNVVIEDSVAFFINPSSSLRVDFLSVDKNTIQKLNDNTVNATIYGYELKVPSLKDLISMKIFALSQNLMRRTAKDLPDIVYLTIINNLNLESDIHLLCDKFGTEEIFDLISTQVKIMEV